MPIEKGTIFLQGAGDVTFFTQPPDAILFIGVLGHAGQFTDDIGGPAHGQGTGIKITAQKVDTRCLSEGAADGIGMKTQTKGGEFVLMFFEMGIQTLGGACTFKFNHFNPDGTAYLRAEVA